MRAAQRLQQAAARQHFQEFGDGGYRHAAAFREFLPGVHALGVSGDERHQHRRVVGELAELQHKADQISTE